MIVPTVVVVVVEKKEEETSAASIEIRLEASKQAVEALNIGTGERKKEVKVC